MFGEFGFLLDSGLANRCRICGKDSKRANKNLAGWNEHDVSPINSIYWIDYCLRKL